jgi:hypothetical protein
MKKSRIHKKLSALELKKETIAQLDQHALQQAIGGNNSTIPSQCRTLCF